MLLLHSLLNQLGGPSPDGLILLLVMGGVAGFNLYCATIGSAKTICSGG